MTQQRYALAGTTDARVIAAMEREFPRWQVWIVYPVIGPKHWHARRWEDADAIPARVIDADCATELIEKIEDAIKWGRKRMTEQLPPMADDDERAEALRRDVMASGPGGGWPDVAHPRWPEPPKPPRKRRRVFMWVFIALQLVFLAWLITGLAQSSGPTPADIANLCGHGKWSPLFRSYQDCATHGGGALNTAGDVGKSIGIGLVIGLWVAVDVILGIGRLIVVTARSRGTRGA